MDREITTLTIGRHRFDVKTYATAREVNTIQQAYFKGAKVELVGDQPRFSEFNPNVQYEVRLEMIRQLVVRMDDSDAEIDTRCEMLPAEFFDELTAALDEIVSKKKT